MFTIKTSVIDRIKTTIVRFEDNSFIIEIFRQYILLFNQNSYKYRLVKYQILKEKGPFFKEKIITLKKQVIKTEPAFAKLLDLKGNSYNAILHYYTK